MKVITDFCRGIPKYERLDQRPKFVKISKMDDGFLKTVNLVAYRSLMLITCGSYDRKNKVNTLKKEEVETKAPMVGLGTGTPVQLVESAQERTIVGPSNRPQAAQPPSGPVAQLIETPPLPATAEVTPENDSGQDPSTYTAEQLFERVITDKYKKIIQELQSMLEYRKKQQRTEEKRIETPEEELEPAEVLDPLKRLAAAEQEVKKRQAELKRAQAEAKEEGEFIARLKNVDRLEEEVKNLHNHYHFLQNLVGTNVTKDDLEQRLREEAFLEEYGISRVHIGNAPGGKKKKGGKSKKIEKRGVSSGEGGGGGGGGGAAKTSAQEQQPQREPDFYGFVNKVFNGRQEPDQQVTIHPRVRRWYKSGITPQQVQSWKGYEGATIEQIEKQMKRHTFPGLARVLTNRIIINQFVSRADSDSPFIIAGFQATAESDFQFGKIQFGIDKGCIYHMQFVELEDLELKKFVDGGQIKRPAAKKDKKGPVQKKDDDRAVFTYVGAIETQASENGENAFLLRFPNNPNAPHLLKLFSLTKYR